MAIVTAEDVRGLLDRITALERALRPFADTYECIEDCLALIDEGYDKETAVLAFGGMEATRLDIEDFGAAYSAYYPGEPR